MSESQEVRLPRFVGSRDEARLLLDRLNDSTGPIVGQVVVLNARNLRSASPSAVAELVTHALVTLRAARLRVISADDDFNEDVLDAAEAAGVPGLVDLARQPLAI